MEQINFKPYLDGSYIDHEGKLCVLVDINKTLYKFNVQGFKVVNGDVLTNMQPVIHFYFFEN